MATAVVVVIFTVEGGHLSVLLIERAAEPCAGQWALPGGVLREAESLDGAASRKLADETGVSDVFLEQLYTFDRLGAGKADIVVTYFALVDLAQTRLRAELEWRPAWHAVRGLPKLAFENERILAYAEERLRNKLEYTNVVYSLLPKRFTLTQMQRVYEAILGEPLDKRNFRRRVVGLAIVKETGQTEKQGAHRPAMFYEFASREPMVF
jgi:8-oxo-dGTP diphosphatase